MVQMFVEGFCWAAMGGMVVGSALSVWFTYFR
jgi:hypothetical protein